MGRRADINTLCIAIGIALALSTASPARAAELRRLSIPTERKLPAKSYLEMLIKDLVVGEMLVRAPEDREATEVVVRIVFDEALWRVDRDKATARDRVAASPPKTVAAKVASDPNGASAKSFPRFGKLNIDLDFKTAAELADLEAKRLQASMLSAPRPALPAPPPALDDLLNYVTLLEVTVSLPERAASGIEASLRDRAAMQPELAMLLDAGHLAIKILPQAAAAPAVVPEALVPAPVVAPAVVAAAASERSATSAVAPPIPAPVVSAPPVAAPPIPAPVVSAPSVAAPQLAAPVVSAAPVAAPQLAAPVVSAAPVAAPQLAVPVDSAAPVAAPQLAFPVVSAAPVAAPQLAAPAVTAPSVGVPQSAPATVIAPTPKILSQELVALGVFVTAFFLLGFGALSRRGAKGVQAGAPVETPKAPAAESAYALHTDGALLAIARELPQPELRKLLETLPNARAFMLLSRLPTATALGVWERLLLDAHPDARCRLLLDFRARASVADEIWVCPWSLSRDEALISVLVRDRVLASELVHVPSTMWRTLAAEVGIGALAACCAALAAGDLRRKIAAALTEFQAASFEAALKSFSGPTLEAIEARSDGYVGAVGQAAARILTRNDALRGEFVRSLTLGTGSVDVAGF